MSRAGVNMAVTKDGGSYNKLRRPDELVASLASTTAPTAELVPAMPAPIDTNKRKLDDAGISDPVSDDEPEPKRSREERISNRTAPTQISSSTDIRRVSRPVRHNGMQSMFPGMDDGESSDDATQEALAYLRSVRSEASNIPNLLVADPTQPEEGGIDRSMYEDGRGDYRAVYKDGTWVAVDLDGGEGEEEYWSEDEVELDHREEYYKSLVRRYKALRNKLAHPDAKDTAASIETDPSKKVNLRVPSSRKQWLHAIDHDYPTPARVARLDEKSLFHGLENCADSLSRFDTITKQTSCWIWTLLALVGERGTLDYWKAGRIRDLGHKAGQLTIRLRDGARHQQLEEDVDEEIEDWDVEGDVVDSEDGEVNEVEEDGKSGKDGAEILPTQLDGFSDQPTNTTSQELQHEARSDNSADMSLSSDHAEAGPSNSAPPAQESEAANLEEARARLLAQLGDRLVQPYIPKPASSTQHRNQNVQQQGTPRPGGRHRHNGAVCRDPNCRISQSRQKAHQKAGARAARGREDASGTAEASSGSRLESRAEAEKERQRLREEELSRAREAAESPGEEAESTRVEAEKAAPPASERSDLAGQESGVPEEITAMQFWATRVASATYEFFPLMKHKAQSGEFERLPPAEQKRKESEFFAAKRHYLQAVAEFVRRRELEELAGAAPLAPEASDSAAQEGGVSGEAAGLQPAQRSPDELVGSDALQNQTVDSTIHSGGKDGDVVDLNTRVTLDMILTIVAECYGQKDLLRYREVW